MRKWTRKKIFKKRDKPTPWQTIHDLGLFVVSNANATMFWYWTVCGRILQVRLNFPRDDRGTKDKGEEDWGRSGIGKVFPAGIGKKPNPWDHYGRANGAREQIYLFAESANQTFHFRNWNFFKKVTDSVQPSFEHIQYRSSFFWTGSRNKKTQLDIMHHMNTCVITEWQKNGNNGETNLSSLKVTTDLESENKLKYLEDIWIIISSYLICESYFRSLENTLLEKWFVLYARLTVLSWQKSTTITFSTPQSPLRWVYRDPNIVQHFTRGGSKLRLQVI